MSMVLSQWSITPLTNDRYDGSIFAEFFWSHPKLRLRRDRLKPFGNNAPPRHWMIAQPPLTVDVGAVVSSDTHFRHSCSHFHQDTQLVHDGMLLFAGMKKFQFEKTRVVIMHLIKKKQTQGC